MEFKPLLILLIVVMLLFGCASFGGQQSEPKKDTTPTPQPSPQPAPEPVDDDYPPPLPDG